MPLNLLWEAVFRGTGQPGDKADGGWLPCRNRGCWGVLMGASADDTGHC
jgi:hypothetical protein